MKTLPLIDNTAIPILGFGTWKLSGSVCQRSVEKALEVGYRHIDTAPVYNNQVDISRAIKASGLPREELFLTSKIWRDKLRYEDVKPTLIKTLDELSCEYLDLYLIHWPNNKIPLAETLKAMYELKGSGLIRAVGVSNFTIHHLDDALATNFPISCNQVEFHPSFYQKDLKKYCDDKKITLTAYSPLAQGKDISLPLIQTLSKNYQRSPAQVILNWIISKNVVAIPRSDDPQKIEDNFHAADWQLSEEDINKIDNLNICERQFSPFFANFDY